MQWIREGRADPLLPADALVVPAPPPELLALPLEHFGLTPEELLSLRWYNMAAAGAACAASFAAHVPALAAVEHAVMPCDNVILDQGSPLLRPYVCGVTFSAETCASPSCCMLRIAGGGQGLGCYIIKDKGGQHHGTSKQRKTTTRGRGEG